MDSLPKELHSVIVSFLDAKSRRALRLASAHWFNTTNTTDFVFNFETEEELREILQHLKKYTQPIGVEFKSSKNVSMPANHLIDEISQLTNVTKLHLGHIDIDTEVPLEALLPLTKLANLQDEDFLTTDFPPEIVRHFSNLRNLSIETIEYAEQLNLDRFTRLEEVRFGYFSLPSSDPLLAIPHTQHITNLTLENAFGATNESNLTKFSNLKVLNIGDSRHQADQRVFNIHSTLSKLNAYHSVTHPSGNQTLTSTTKMLLAIQTLTKLKKLSLHQPNNLPDDYDSIDILRLEQLTELQELTFGNNDQFCIDLSTCKHLPLTRLSLNSIEHQDVAHLVAISTLQSLVIHYVAALDNDSIAMMTGFHNLTRLNMLNVNMNVNRKLLESLPIRLCRIQWENGEYGVFIKKKLFK